MANTDIKRYADKSSITFKRIGERVQVTARFAYKSARYEIDGVIDVANQRIEPFHHRFTLANKNVFDATMLIGIDGDVRSEYRFGAATKGVRELVLKSQPVKGSSLLQGAADGVEILPFVHDGCECKDKPLRPMLLWSDDGSTKPVMLRFAVGRASVGEIEGLAQVTQMTIARVNNGFFGDALGPLGGCIDFGICLLQCGLEKLWCIVGNLGRPGGDVLTTICLAVPGSCFSWCGMTSPPF